MNTLTRSAQWLRRWARKHWIISTLLVLMAVWKGFWWVVYTPIRNPWPQEAYTIRGRFPFDQGYELMFYQYVYGGADWHQRLCGGGIFYLLGYQTSTATCKGDGFLTKPRQIDDQHYEVTLYRDAYFSGLQDWTVNTMHTQYKAGVNYEIRGFTDYGAPENSACADSSERLKLHENKLVCMPQTEHKDFKNLVITAAPSSGADQNIRNFWLYSELDQMLTKGR